MSRVFRRQLHITRLDDVDERVLKKLFVIGRDRGWIIRDGQAAAAPVAQAHDELLIGFRIIAHPTAAPAPGTVAQPGEGKFPLFRGVPVWTAPANPAQMPTQ